MQEFCYDFLFPVLYPFVQIHHSDRKTKFLCDHGEEWSQKDKHSEDFVLLAGKLA